jgi:protein gp37
MGETTGISWTDHTFNPWWGCVKVSPACQHCYAETFAKRVGQKVWGVKAERRFFGPKHWAEPLKWNRAAAKAGVRRRVFCASMADVFEDREELHATRADLFVLIEKTEHLDWLLLTKRPENIRKLWPRGFYEPGPDWWPNLWLGTTVESQEYAESRLPPLLDVNAAVHFVSYEPALGPVNFTPWMDHECGDPPHGRCPNELAWIIAGGESGANARAGEAAWYRQVRDDCAAFRKAFHFKQWGGRTPTANGCELDGREWKQFPNVERAVARG